MIPQPRNKAKRGTKNILQWDASSGSDGRYRIRSGNGEGEHEGSNGRG